MTREATIFLSLSLSPPQKCTLQHRLPGNWGGPSLSRTRHGRKNLRDSISISASAELTKGDDDDNHIHISNQALLCTLSTFRSRSTDQGRKQIDDLSVTFSLVLSVTLSVVCLHFNPVPPRCPARARARLENKFLLCFGQYIPLDSRSRTRVSQTTGVSVPAQSGAKSR